MSLKQNTVFLEFVLLTFIVLLPACNFQEQGSDPIYEITRYSISPKAIICAGEYDTLFTLGAVSDADHLSNGNIAVLDRLTAAAYIFSSEGEFLSRAGRRGSGPGEFNSPDALVPLNGDSMLIFDRSIRKISVYSNDGTFLYDIEENLESIFPYWAEQSSPDNFSGGIMFMNSTESGYETEYSVCSFGIDLCPVDTFFTNRALLIPGDLSSMIQNSVFSCGFTCDSQGNTFVAPASTDQYVIQGFNSLGECFLTIEKEITPLRKTSEELANETERFNTMYSARSSGEPVNYTPLEFRYTIPPQGLHADNLGRIWVLNGHSDRFLFEVYDYSGALLFDVELCGIDPEETIGSGMMWWNISEHGLLGFSLDPVNIPEIYVFELPE